MNSKQKGNKFERLCVNKAKEIGLTAQRAWGSNGKALGLTEDVDILIDDIPFQCKSRKHIADYIFPNEHVFAQLIKRNRGETYAVLRYSDFLKIIKECDVKRITRIERGRE